MASTPADGLLRRPPVPIVVVSSHDQDHADHGGGDRQGPAPASPGSEAMLRPNRASARAAAGRAGRTLDSSDDEVYSYKPRSVKVRELCDTCRVVMPWDLTERLWLVNLMSRLVQCGCSALRGERSAVIAQCRSHVLGGLELRSAWGIGSIGSSAGWPILLPAG